MTSFSESERERIEAKLLDAGRERFAKYGYRKTTIGELTDDARTARRTFYRFFDSKAARYVAVVEREAERILGPLITGTLADHDDPQIGVEHFLQELLAVIETNDHLQSMIVADEYDAIRSQVSPDNVEVRRNESLQALIPHIRRWQDEGEMVNRDPSVIAGVIRSVAFLPVQRVEIGEQYEDVRTLLIQSIASGLTTSSE
ncbi:Transcriptional regulator, TetR/AcrR family [Halanaeroarchaeum sp. HSR-CO]|uniref:TetR/AcrR family transcriptional regulator n=1 Tax=Halanaeroarchaeum sp. HSR-CO TaxID=2866382 RepID=UPI00217E1C46|nr:TetR/AcrR family transcriptional regulator [Halanaeroarchaeum sp. HSR-CO]UWG47834.1 Transcriptional regulator, TetR/AcrR family [Halanaeroarchaeum sp. HSR-CO]